MKAIGRALAFALLLGTSVAGMAETAYPVERMDGPIGKFMAGQSIAMGLYMRGIDVAEQQSAEVLKNRARLLDGTWELAGMYDGFATVLTNEADWDKALQQLQKWKAEYPASKTEPVAEATYWIAYASLARGGEWASRVPPKAWELYGARMTRAREVLEAAKDRGNPHWYTAMLDVAFAQNWPADERLALFQEAVRQEPYYYSHYFRVAIGLTPRWGGKLEDFHSFVVASVGRTHERDGSTMYARLYWILTAIEWDVDPFTDLGIPWEKMRQGFDDLTERYPNSEWNLNHYAYFACRANDASTFARLARRIEKPMREAWSGSYTLDYCKELLLKRA